MPKNLLALLLSLAPLLPAQGWTETADAGQLLNSAQAPLGGGPLASITGALSGTDPTCS